MQYAYQVKRVTISGTSFAGAEQWSTGFYLGNSGFDAAAPNQQEADDIRTAWTAFFTSVDSGIASTWKTDNVKVAQVGTDGKTNLDNVVYAPYGTAISGGGNGLSYPPQIALVATLENTGQRGLASKGRMYLPGVNLSLGTNGQISTAQVNLLLAKFKTFIDAVNTAAGIDDRVILASQGRRVKGTDGKYTPVPGTAINAAVDRVRVGSVFDTQRRRRNALVETYQTAVVA